MASVSLKNINKYFKTVCAAKDVSLEARDGEFLVLVGPSGCGKTTLLRIVAGLAEADSGEVWIGDRLVNDISPRDRDVAMVFQSYALYPHMNVFDNLAFGLRIRRVPEAEIKSRVQEAAQMLGLGELLKRRPKQLSGGQLQRVALGRAIVRKPQVFLMDEPLSNLDAQLRVQTRAELIKLHHRLGITTVYVTHDQTEAMTMGQRIAVLRDGLLQQIDAPMEIYRNPANKFVAGFIGSPTMNFIPVTVRSDGDGIYVEGKGLRLRLPDTAREAANNLSDKPAIFGIRPVDLHHSKRSPIPSTPHNTALLTIDVIEPMGETSYIYFMTNGTPLIAEMPADAPAKMGEQIDVVFDISKAHLFDPDTESTVF